MKKTEFVKRPGQYAPYLRQPPPAFSFWQDIGFSLSFIALFLFPFAIIVTVGYLLLHG